MPISYGREGTRRTSWRPTSLGGAHGFAFASARLLRSTRLRNTEQASNLVNTWCPSSLHPRPPLALTESPLALSRCKPLFSRAILIAGTPRERAHPRCGTTLRVLGRPSFDPGLARCASLGCDRPYLRAPFAGGAGTAGATPHAGHDCAIPYAGRHVRQRPSLRGSGWGADANSYG